MNPSAADDTAEGEANQPYWPHRWATVKETNVDALPARGGGVPPVVAPGRTRLAVALRRTRWSTGGVRTRLGIGATLAALFLPVVPAAADSLRLQTVTERSVIGARVVYLGDEGPNRVKIDLARNLHVSEPNAPNPDQIIGFRVRGASPASGCELTGANDYEQVCRVPDGRRLLAPHVYARAGDDRILIGLPRRDAVIFGGPGRDWLSGPVGPDDETGLPGELRGGPGNDDLSAAGLLYGGPGDDELNPWEGPGPFRSRVVAGPGDDRIDGSDRPDVIDAGPGRDEVWVWGGNDVIRTRDGQPDKVDCYTGRDVLTADGRDGSAGVQGTDGPLSDCDRVKRRGEPFPAPIEFYGWEYDRYVTVAYGCPSDGPRLCVGAMALRRGGCLIARRPLRDPAGTWGTVDFPLGYRRIARLVDKDIRVTIRWRDRAGRMRSVATTIQIHGPEGEDN